MKDKEIIEFLSTLLYYVEKGYPLPVAFKNTKSIKKVKNFDYDKLYMLSREFVLSYYSFKSSKRSGKAREFINGKNGLKFPNWMKEKLQKYIDIEILEKSFFIKNEWIRVNTLKGDIDKIVKSLESHNVEVEEDNELPYMLKVLKGDPRKTDEFKNYQIVFQDKASALVVESLRPETNDVIIDLSSAPGMKVSQIMSITDNNAKIYAADIDVNRLHKEIEFLKNMGVNLNKIEFILQDSSYSSIREGDKVLIDAPCSSSGMISNEPTILVTLTEEKIKKYATIQENILIEAIENIRASYIIYSVCSIFPEEGEMHMDKFIDLLERPNISGNSGYEGFLSSKYAIRLFPYSNSTEGFFISKLNLSK
ncbi:RsmB/NOP family class I SAM-dependent RNA methyltransferase [Acidianus sulfidivorans JP7]|uniref:SAM-dependent MTase RsmB/NOP-type domain-containing protein n=1 Tax=Acidianus sulfidivorans JP7 TaxID=619593 RepID=A0A2U9IM48_9CREN|nr:RsmB/NOP family class I SAM-dependent RNA methyltransferase [Acidianus sulfidivorans]AWR97083.1 RsmB/NOP family class I SAM-dependent RNA methyltransferase [Acidianus sulfidivorans JP7]